MYLQALAVEPLQHTAGRLQLRPPVPLCSWPMLTGWVLRQIKPGCKKPEPAAISLSGQIMLLELLPELSLPSSLRLINSKLWVSPDEAALFWTELYCSH